MIRCQLLKFHEIAILPQPQWHGMAWHGSAVFRSRKNYLQSAENNFIILSKKELESKRIIKSSLVIVHIKETNTHYASTTTHDSQSNTTSTHIIRKHVQQKIQDFSPLRTKLVLYVAEMHSNMASSHWK